MTEEKTELPNAETIGLLEKKCTPTLPVAWFLPSGA
ncbi:hypothetical protein KGM_212399 [Danaus plexippus plexippus]|uniref:Uncharacterized protein n=1 Tax=Danaus plexippus plexippus TaxID=278856 RepID=A0A212ELP3_DANPL|nr:hypothetical protein KGM_212399 [Danaus plexippus plexippus]